MKAKKIILFIVEGVTDQTSLGLVLDRLLTGSQVHFAITGGDITTKSGSNPNNITAKVGNLVRNYSGSTFTPKDFLEVVHLVDTDGAFIKRDRVLPYSGAEKMKYTDDAIYTHHPDNIIHRNRQKSDNLNKLLGLERIWGSIPYSLYFFSCNLDHVLHGSSNMERREKVDSAIRFEDQFINDPKGFVSFMSGSSFTVPGTLKETWTFIKANRNSLKRYSNFHLYLKDKQ